jgi:hypothetical protein
MNIAHETIRAARKPHQCDWCNETIEEGQSYVRQRNKDGADIWTWRAHPECHDAASRVPCYDIDHHTGVQHARGCEFEVGDTSCDCAAHVARHGVAP